MPGWADRKIQELAKKQEDERLKNEKSAQEQAQKLAEAPQLWDQLLLVLKQEIDRYNETFPHQLSLNDRSVKDDADTSSKLLQAPESEVPLVFHRNVPQIYYKVRKSRGPNQTKADARDGRFFFEVRRDGVWLVHKSGGWRDGEHDVPSAAGVLLDSLFE